MKKLLTAKSLSFIMLLSLLGGKAEANRHYDNDGYVDDRGGDCCRSSCYECGCNPLYCGAWDLQVHAGVTPIVWRNRGDWLLVTPGGGILTVGSGPKFSKLFKTPWHVGGQVGYHMSDNSRVYVEFDYTQAQRKEGVSLLNLVGVTAFNVTPAKYKIIDVYVGARYYWDRWCDRTSFFLGGKVGVTRHKRSRFNFTINTTNFTDQDVFRRNTKVIGGVDFGLDFCFCGNWSFVITGNVLASCGPRVSPFLAAAISALSTNLIPGGIGTELRFPINLGVRYSF